MWLDIGVFWVERMGVGMSGSEMSLYLWEEYLVNRQHVSLSTARLKDYDFKFSKRQILATDVLRVEALKTNEGF